MESNKQVTIVTVNYRTYEMTELCMHNLKCYTDLSKAHIIVVDNASNDQSLEYLKGLDWITLITRDANEGSGPRMHASALDIAMQQVKTPYVLVIHTDTIVLRPDWLDFLLGKIEADPTIGAVGSWKLERLPWWKRVGKKIENLLHRFQRRTHLDRPHYFRSHCALYKTDLLRACHSTFSSGESAGIDIFNELAQKGYALPFIESEELCRYMLHLNHATAILNPSPTARKTAAPGRKEKLMKELQALKSK